MTNQTCKIAAISGWMFVALLVAGNLLPGLAPGASASSDDISQYFAVHRTIFLGAMVLDGLSVWPFLIFAVTLARVLENSHFDMMSSLLIALASVAAAVALAVAWFWAVLAYRAPAGYEPAITQVVFDLGNIGYNFIGFPFAAFLAMASLRMRASHWGPLWLPWTGFLAAVGQLATAAAFARRGILSPGGSGFIAAFLVFALWIVLASISLWKQTSRNETSLI